MKADQERHYFVLSGGSRDDRTNTTELDFLVDYLQECDCRDEHEVLAYGVPIR